MKAMLDRPITEIADAVSKGDESAERIAEQTLARLSSAAHLGAFVHTSDARVLEQAKRLDERRAKGEKLGKLAGVPIAIKDAIDTVDFPTTCGSRILHRKLGVTPESGSGWMSPYDATVIERLRAADAIIVGKTNMDEFAMGSSTETSAFGPARNPWDPERTPGGSSGGSAVAVAARVTPVALGSDTGGSIRQPAALCGVVGLKPSYGRVSRYGLVAYASSLDQIGPFSNDVRSSARLLSVIAGTDPHDATCSSAPVPDFEAACDRSARGLRLGMPAEYFADGLDPEIRASVEHAIAKFKDAGVSVEPVTLPHTKYGVATYYILATAEASSNLSRFDGVRFGLRVEPPRSDLSTLYGATRDEGFGREVKRRILLGTYVLSAGYYDAYYRKAQRVRSLIVADFERAFAKVDAIVTPTTPTPAFRLGEKTADPLAMYLEDVYTLPCNLAGLCGMSLPALPTRARADRPALPVGMQLLAPPLQEEVLFTLGATWEQVLGGFAAPPTVSRS
jgi:aspartyl-tRNA(Asn)/glutamyl-tRNA(Gln) amidotransferase subunit A